MVGSRSLCRATTGAEDHAPLQIRPTRLLRPAPCITKLHAERERLNEHSNELPIDERTRELYGPGPPSPKQTEWRWFQNRRRIYRDVQEILDGIAALDQIHIVSQGSVGLNVGSVASSKSKLNIFESSAASNCGQFCQSVKMPSAKKSSVPVAEAYMGANVSC